MRAGTIPNLPDLFAEALRHHQDGRLAEAGILYRLLLAIEPSHADSLHLSGIVSYQAGQAASAVSSISRAVALNNAAAHYHSNLALALQDLGRSEAALRNCKSALVLAPGYRDALHNLGRCLRQQGAVEQAIGSYARAQSVDPTSGESARNLGDLFAEQGRFDQASLRYVEARRCQPDRAEIHNNLGAALQQQGRLSDAVASDRLAILLEPDYADPYNNMGTALKEQGCLGEALVCYRRAVSVGRDRPGRAKAFSNLIMALHYSAEHEPSVILAEARGFSASLDGETVTRSFPNLPIPGRRLRVGYVSGDFRAHPVGSFLVRVLEAHDPEAIEITCYSNSRFADGMTERLRRAADHWRSIADLDDDQARAMIERDAIDILVDLSGHTGENRLPLFALRPAPVQVSWLGYFGTTGLAAMDYVLADRRVLPPGDERFFTEQPWYLPGCYLCYTPPGLDIAVGPPPMIANGFVTFGCFNNAAKLSPEALDVWAAILRQVAGSRLFLKTNSLADPLYRAGLINAFAALGIAEERLIFAGHSPLPELLAAYNQVDVALDPFPFGGCTTSADTLWMGVPLVTLCGERWTGRMSVTILATLGLAEWAAADGGHYVDIACRLASDRAGLTALRRDLRRRLETSSFCDARRFTSGIEEAFRGMWLRWCAKSAAGLYWDHRLIESEALYRQILAADRFHEEALHGLGLIAYRQGRLDAAGKFFFAALLLNPQRADFYSNSGAVLSSLEKSARAELVYRRGLRLMPEFPNAHDNLGALHADQRKFPEAVTCHHRALILQPDHVGARNNLGVVARHLGQLTKAEIEFRRALVMDPTHAKAHTNLAIILLLSGRLPEAWPHYEWRWQGGDDHLRTRSFPIPQWDGAALAGRTILLYGEQGMGDVLMLCRFAPLVAAQGRVLLQVPQKMIHLLTPLSDIMEIFAEGASLPKFDLHCPLGSLPGAFRTTRETIPAPVIPALDEDRVAKWRDLLPPSGLRVGICWQGNPSYPADRERSAPLAAFLPLSAIAGVHLISLQTHHGLQQIPDLPGLITLGDDFDAGPDAFIDTAAVMMSLDLVITIDSAIAHLAGALGRPVWLALPTVPYWVWMLDREDSCWYPGMRLFRQTIRGNWQGPFARMARELAAQQCH